MSRLADYFVICGIDRDSKNEEVGGRVIQRFPSKDRKDAAFPEGIELFCQPGGWNYSNYYKPPTFFVAVLTDMEGDHRYCACFTFHERCTPTKSKKKLANSSSKEGFRDESQSDSSLSEKRFSEMPGISVNSEEAVIMDVFAPKCLCLVSRASYFDILKNCLTTIYLSFLSGNTKSLEGLVGCILGFVQVPPPGGPKMTFSMGAGDRHTLSPPASETLPVTGKSVAILFNQLGIHNMLALFCAALTENKILFYSSSYSQLTHATQAMLALMYPLKFSYVFIPILPSVLLEFLSAPTPYIMGVHDSYKDNVVPDLADVILVDIDGGHVFFPDAINLASLPEPFLGRTRHELTLVLHPQLVTADCAFQAPTSPSPPELQDKELRAVFIRLLAQLFSGYRSCLTLIRIHPKPVITFNKVSFLEYRGMIGDPFLSKVLESISFLSFVAHRGPPYRTCDLFDQLCVEIDSILNGEGGVDAEVQASIEQLAQKLYDNEPSCDTNENTVQPVVPSDEADLCDKLVFPELSESDINCYIDQQENVAAPYMVKSPEPCVVPSNLVSSKQQHYIPSRKLEVLRDCVAYIFDNQISEARKTLESVLRALKSKGAQLALCHELSLRVKQNRSLLEHDQFDLVVRLMNRALEDDASMSNTEVAAALLPLTATFCRKLHAGVIQFAYTCVQDHPVWERQQFWEEAFYTDVQAQIKQLYVDDEAPKAITEDTLDRKDQRISRASLTPVTKHRSISRSRDNLASQPKESGSSSDLEQPKQAEQKPVPSALSIAAKQLKKWPNYSKMEQDFLISSEEGIVYSQAIHYANRMVYMRIPLDASEKMPAPTPVPTPVTGSIHVDGEGSVNGTYAESIVNGGTVANSEVGSCITDSGGWDMYMDDEDGGTIADQVTKFVCRFVDRVGTEAGISQEHLKSLYTMIPGVVAMHIESLEPVYREYKNLAPIQKAKIMRPDMLQGEEMLSDGLRAYLVPDGRELGKGGEGPCLLPAEGAVFLTNYRVIFKGTPVDQFASEMIVTRSFPVGALITQKKIGVQYMQHLGQWLHECIQLRSSTFQMMKLAFDEEVEQEVIETFRKKLQKRHLPNTVFGSFAFCGKGIARTPTVVIQKHMERQGTLKKTKNKLVNASRHKTSQLRGSLRKRRHRHNDLDSQRSPSGSLTTDDDDSVLELNDIPLKVEPVVQGVDRLSKLSYCNDYSRLKLGNIAKDSPVGPWRICMVNVTYTACRSYPSVVLVPHSISDDSILRIARNHRQGRFPVAVWRHQYNKATLLRAGGIERSTIGSIMRQTKTVSGSGVTHHAISSSASVEQEKYFAAVVLEMSRKGDLMKSMNNATDFATYLIALFEFLHEGKTDTFKVAATPLGKSKNIARASSLHHGVVLRDGFFPDEVDSGQLVDKTILRKGWEPAALYIFGDKSLLRNVKQEAYPKCEFVPIELPDIRAVRASFKKFQRATCPSTETNLSFIQQVEESEWLPQLSAIMTVANCFVDLIDIQGSSVLVCFEDGWDATAQVLSLAELMLDPHYRTIDGFKLLIEKEWLAFGHRFTHRGNQTASAQAGFTPVFLQFLDCVHQIMLQFPLSFEFNDHFLSTIAYHHVSMRFRTFLLDSEHERMESGWMVEEDGKPRGKSLWDYMDFQKSRSPLYNNFLYSPGLHKVLRPFCKVPNLKVWKYYTTENLSTGPTYDLELINNVTTTTENEQQSGDGRQETYGSCMSGVYGDVTQFSSDECSWLLQELYRLEEEADQKPKKWEHHWHGLSCPPRKRLPWVLNRRWNTHQRLNFHKKGTMEVILKGKLQLEERGAQGFSQPHNFVAHTFMPPSNCDHCYQMIIGILNRGMKCTECGYNCHERCQPQVPWQCKKRDLPEQPGSGMTKSTMSLPSETDASQTKKLHCGHLYKKGHLLRQWKARWFVLDTQRNQLRYYDGEHDQHLQGYVDLGEMTAVQALNSIPPGAPKGSEKGAFFDLRTTKRVYNLMCESPEEAKIWVEKLQNMNV